MANTIKLKRASGSDPGASDLVVGEVAIRTDTAKLFTKKDDNSVAEIGVTALGNNDVTTSTIADDAVTYAKIQNVSATNRILGRDSSGAGVVEEITPANLRTMINVEDGATADQTKSDIDGLGIAASTAATLATARTIAGVSFNGSANISLNNNAITNGAGYITSADGGNAATLDGIDSASFLRSDATDIKTAGHLTFNDNVKTKFGTGGDLEIYHDAANSLLQNSTGYLGIRSDTLFLQDKTDGHAYITCVKDGAVGLRYDNNTKFETTSSGGTLTGTLVANAFTGPLTGNVTGNASGSSGSCTGNAATATKLASARTIAGVSFDGSANISLNNNAITNGAGYITSANGGNAATLDSLDSSQFLRSDDADTATGVLTLNGGLNFGADARCPAAISALSDGSTITIDFVSGIHHSVTLGGNRTFGDPNHDGSAVGQSGSIFITQDGTGSRTASFHSDYKFVGGTAPTLSTAANAVDRIDYVVKASGHIHCAVSLDIK